VQELGDRLEVAVDERAVAADDDLYGFEAHARERIRSSSARNRPRTRLRAARRP
jgi:hypothetical protein